MVQRQADDFTGIRVTTTTTVSYDDVLDKLNREIQANGVVSTNETKSAVANGASAFVDYISAKVGPLGFTQFHDINHGPWIRLFGVGNGLRLHRVVLGNPLIAITMLKHDLYSGLFVPVEILLKEKDKEGTDVIYILPSSLVTAVNQNVELRVAAEELDRKLDRLIRHITS